MSLRWRLFGTAACHLCDQAQAMLGQHHVNYQYQEIAQDESLLDAYAIRIPVLQCQLCSYELDWPFALQTILKHQSFCIREVVDEKPRMD